MESLDLGVAEHMAYAFQLSLGVIFLLAAISKLRAPTVFARTVLAYDLLPARIVRLSAFGVIAVEWFLAIALLTGWLLMVALPLAIAMLIAFAAAVGINLRRGRRVPCGCFGNRNEQISPRGIVRLVFLLIGCVLLAALAAASRAPLTVDSLSGAGLAGLAYAFEMATVAAFLTMLGLWLLHLPELTPIVRNLGKLN